MSLSTEQYFIAGFIALVTLFSLSQIIRAIIYGRITTPSSGMRTKERTARPLGFWLSLVYYIVWVTGASWTIIAYFISGGRLPF